MIYNVAEKGKRVYERERIRKKGFLGDIIMAEHGKLRLEVQKWQKVFIPKKKKMFTLQRFMH